MAEKDRAMAERERRLHGQQTALDRERASLDKEVAERVAAARKCIADEEALKARRVAAGEIDAKARELAELKAILREREDKLADAQKAHAEVLRKERALDDAKREMDVTIERQVQASLATVRDKAKQEAEDSLKLRVLEKEEQISSMQRQIEELKRRAEQGSQQLQGEVLELELEAMLRAKFPRDIVEPVPKGEYGGDVVQQVMGPLNQPCGKILWESKRTKNWTDGWLAKLREDRRKANADIALIVSNALPKGVHTFDHIDGIWVTE